MPRTAHNPNKLDIPAPAVDVTQEKVYIKEEGRCPAVTLAILTHYRHDPYHRHRIPVIELCASSMRDGAKERDCELLIFDNGSTADFKKKLKSFDPDILVLSPNIGKQSAQQRMLEYARGRYFAYSDDDIYFYPGWLCKHLEILDTFNAWPTLVSGSPQRTAFQWGIRSTLDFCYRNPGMLQIGRFIPDECEKQYALSIGRPMDVHMLKTVQLRDYLITYRGIKAWAHAHHMQFIARRSDLIGKLPPSKFLIDNAREWDMYMDGVHNFLRLTTYERTTLHIGNELQGDLTAGKHM